MKMNPYNPQYYGYSPASDKQLMSGSAPYVYNFLPHDSKSCIVAKSAYNYTHSSIYTPDTIVRSHPASSVIQGSTLGIQEQMIKTHCQPSFKIDSTTATFASSGYGSTSYGSSNYGTSHYG